MKILVSLLVIGILSFSCGSKELTVDEPEPVATQPAEQPAESPQPAPVQPVTEVTQEEKPEPPASIADVTPEPAKAAAASLQDSIDVMYMIKPNDYLVKIAINEYGRPTMWRKIWNWNYEVIGDNPNLIYPYRELALKKPIEYANKVEFSWYDYTVRKDDTLWSIAKKEYDNNLAWIVILRDNYDEIGDSYNTLRENTTLKLRTKLY
ncbi:MAG TPA: LysM peptidoglycan-binding domain-containing protein [Candidatus Marinimicrobia bacterium]|nr:LysM peptidoglycan-binding domain-containing protein [Candidatus Neomarinimicrobiota bacterium]